MSSSSTLMSSLSAIELLAKRVWERSRARIRGMRSGGAFPKTLTTRLSPTTRLPLEIIEMVIADFIYDKWDLLACSLICRSWYTASFPHLHHALVVKTFSSHHAPRLGWPKPLQHASKHGLLPFVKKFRVRVGFYDVAMFSPRLFNWRTLRQFSALINVQELVIDYLDVPSFMPKIRRYFGHFSQTVRSLALRKPKGSRRQIIFFIGLFEHLEDLKLLYDVIYPQGEKTADNRSLVPSFIPPLRGRLTITCFGKDVGLLQDMIDLFGGIRFHHMDLFNVKGTRLLLGACAETLETLRLCPTDPHAKSSLRDFNLSRNKSLRILQVAACSIDDVLRARSPNVATSLLTYALSTITSPVFTELTAIYRDYDFRGVEPSWPDQPCLRERLPAEEVEEALWHCRLFKAFRTIREIRDFRLVLCADVWHRVGGYSVRVLKEAVAAEKARRGFDDIFPEPLVIYSPRAVRPKGPRRMLGWVPQ